MHIRHGDKVNEGGIVLPLQSYLVEGKKISQRMKKSLSLFDSLSLSLSLPQTISEEQRKEKERERRDILTLLGKADNEPCRDQNCLNAFICTDDWRKSFSLSLSSLSNFLSLSLSSPSPPLSLSCLSPTLSPYNLLSVHLSDSSFSPFLQKLPCQ